MEKEINATEAARRMGDHLDDVLRGHSFVISRKGKPVARIVGYVEPEKAFNPEDVRRALEEDVEAWDL